MEKFKTPKEIKLLMGPHHGEYEVPRPSYYRNFTSVSIIINNILSKDKFMKMGVEVLRQLEKDGYNITPFWVKGHKPTDRELETELLEWGHYEIIDIDLTFKESILAFEEYMVDFRTWCIHIFANSGGDDDTYDYCPSMMDAFQQLLSEYKGEEAVDEFRKELYLTDPEFPEYFEDDELERWKKDGI